MRSETGVTKSQLSRDAVCLWSRCKCSPLLSYLSSTQSHFYNYAMHCARWRPDYKRRVKVEVDHVTAEQEQAAFVRRFAGRGRCLCISPPKVQSHQRNSRWKSRNVRCRDFIAREIKVILDPGFFLHSWREWILMHQRCFLRFLFVNKHKPIAQDKWRNGSFLSTGLHSDVITTAVVCRYFHISFDIGLRVAWWR